MPPSFVRGALRRYATPARAKTNAWFFKTGAGQYGHGDRFLGVTVPQQRAVAQRFVHLPLPQVQRCLRSPYHEERLTAVFILVRQYQRAQDDAVRGRLVRFYLKNARRINNWDLVDSSAGYVLGHWLRTHPRGILTRLARSRSLWERRIAIIATQALIAQGQYADTLRIAKLLLNDEHDLLHKAVGWMLREVGKSNRAAEERFLQQYAHRMPRTMLRYAIEKFPETKRQRYLRATAS